MKAARFAQTACLAVGLIVPAAATTPEPAEPGSPAKPQFIQELNLIHFSHTDFGFTDHPAVCRELHRRYLDVALDVMEATRSLPEAARFRWTAETTEPVADWWQTASPTRRRQLLAAVRAGQLEVTALPFNNTPFLNRDQWQLMAHWLPEDLARQVQVRAAVQNDVNGFPRAGAKALLDRGVRYLFMGINTDSGGTPLPRLTAFWWKQPDGRRLWVWISLSYGDGFYFFEPAEWRRGPLPRAADAQFRPPRAGDILKTDEASLRRAHAQCLSRLRQIEANGYRYRVLPISMTSMWRYDNDPPFPPLSDFVAAWNKLGLQPTLRLMTVSQAMANLEQAAGGSAPEYEGEWTDWWANGSACAPRELAASRLAKRYLAAAQSPVWGPMDAPTRRRVEQLLRDLCLFDEHTWGSSVSVAQPYSFDAQGQWNEKARLAWRPLALAEWLLGQRARLRLAGQGQGLWVANPAPEAFSGWVTLNRTCLRGDYQAVTDTASGRSFKLHFEPGPMWARPRGPADLSPEDVSATFPDQAADRLARFWVDPLPAHSVRGFRLSTGSAEEAGEAAGPGPTVQTNQTGWPIGAVWPGMSRTLFREGLGDLVVVKVRGFAPRWVLRDMWEAAEAQRAQLRQQMLEVSLAEPEGPTRLEQTAYTLRYTQRLKHPRLLRASRRLELWKAEPRARLTLRLNRLSSFDPELLCAVSPLPCDGVLPRFSCGGLGFTPFSDQLPGTCRDYFAIDGWAHYPTAAGHWLWVSRDAPLVSLDGPHPRAGLTEPPKRTGRLVSILYDNFWYTNFQGDSPGVMEFEFDLVWRPTLDGDSQAEALATSLVTEPVVVLNPDQPEDPAVLKRLFTP